MPGAERAYALCRLGPLNFAVPSEEVVQAMPRPASLMEVPLRAGGGTPVFMLRGHAIALQELPRLVPGLDDQREHSADKILVLRLEDRWLAIGIDQLVGMRRIQEEQVVTIHHAGLEHELFHSVLLPDEGAPEALPVSVIDVQALFRLSGCWGPAQSRRSPSVGPTEHVSPVAAETLYAMVRLQNHRLLIDAGMLASVEPMPNVQRIGNNESDLLGLTRWRGQDIQVSGLQSLLGPQNETAQRRLLAVLTDGNKTMGLAIDETHHIERFADALRQDVIAGGIAPHHALRGLMYNAKGERLLVLDIPGMLARCADLGTPQSAVAQATSLVKQRDEPEVAHVVFQAGPSWAMPIDRIEAIVAFPSDVHDCTGCHPAQIGSFNWRNQAVALWDLKALNAGGGTPPETERRVLLVRRQGYIVGLVVERLLKLLPARQGHINRLAQSEGVVTLLSVQQAQGGVQSFRVLEAEFSLPTAAHS